MAWFIQQTEQEAELRVKEAVEETIKQEEEGAGLGLDDDTNGLPPNKTKWPLESSEYKEYLRDIEHKYLGIIGIWSDQRRYHPVGSSNLSPEERVARISAKEHVQVLLEFMDAHSDRNGLVPAHVCDEIERKAQSLFSRDCQRLQSYQLKRLEKILADQM